MILGRDVLEAGNQLLDEGNRHEAVHRRVDGVPDVFMLGRVLDERRERRGGVLRVARALGEVVRVDDLDGLLRDVRFVEGGHGREM